MTSSELIKALVNNQRHTVDTQSHLNIQATNKLTVVFIRYRWLPVDDATQRTGQGGGGHCNIAQTTDIFGTKTVV